MTYYIAEKNPETGKFEIWDTERNGKTVPHEYRDESEVIKMYESVVRFKGIDNFLLLEDMPLDVTVEVKKLNPKI